MQVLQGSETVSLGPENLQVGVEHLSESTPVGLSSDIALKDIDPGLLISRALEPVSSELESLASLLIPFTFAETMTSREVVKHVLSGGGKKIRPALYFFAAKLVGYQGDHLQSMAAVCEFVHTASLLHDDVIDNSTLRRNKPTPNSIWGDEASVLTGDLIYARASEMMAETGSLEIVSMFAKAIRHMSEGELLQLEYLYRDDITEDVYFKIIEYKTAILLSAACKAPAILSGRSEQECLALASFGHAVGFSFQLLDDALDYAGTTSVFGKETLADLPEGKVTMPIMLLRNQASSSEWQEVTKIIRKSEITTRDMHRVLELVNHYDTAGQTLALAETYTNDALKALEMFPESAERTNLESLAKSLLLRAL